MDVKACLKAEFSAVTVPIALGCVLGKIGPLQVISAKFEYDGDQQTTVERFPS